MTSTIASTITPTLVVTMCLSCTLVACGSTDRGGMTSSTGGATTGTIGTSTSGPTGCLMMGTDGSYGLSANAANNYSFASTVTLNVTKVAPNAPLTFDWSGLTKDLMKQPLTVGTGGEVASVLVSILALTVDDFQSKINANERLTSYSWGALAYYPTAETSADLYDFAVPGNPDPATASDIDPYLDPTAYPPEANTFAALVQDETDPARGIRMVQAFQLDPASLNTTVNITNTSSDLMYTTDLAAVVPVQVPMATPNVTVDWESMTVNGLGDEWERRSVNEVMVGHYSLTPEELTTQFLGLENIADQLYRARVEAGNTMSLLALTEETTGAAFTGIDASGTWILALNCTTCTNPAPWFLTILTPC